jgi:hypothetical protein
LPSSGSDPGRPEIPHIKTPAVENAARAILCPLDNGPVAMKLDQPAAIDGPQQTRTAGTVERTVAAPAEQDHGVPAQCGGALCPLQGRPQRCAGMSGGGRRWRRWPTPTWSLGAQAQQWRIAVRRKENPAGGWAGFSIETTGDRGRSGRSSDGWSSTARVWFNPTSKKAPATGHDRGHLTAGGCRRLRRGTGATSAGLIQFNDDTVPIRGRRRAAPSPHQMPSPPLRCPVVLEGI